jgi:hypothetical protein
MPPVEESISTWAFKEWIDSACWLMLSINPCCVASWSGAFEYCSSTGRVRNTQPDVDSTARNKGKSRKERRLIKIKENLCTFEYIALERLQ